MARSVAVVERARPAAGRAPSSWTVSGQRDADEVAADRRADAVLAKGLPTTAGPRDLGPAFGHDFSRVRLHADGVAADLTRLFDARALTIGRQVFFAPGEYAPGTERGHRLLVHELAHVAQHDEHAMPRIRRQFAGCADLVSGPNVSLLTGGAVHSMIQADFARRVVGALTVVIPGGSFAPYRTGGICGGPPKVIPPQVIGGAAGGGIPDLARLSPLGVLSVGEIKPAVPECLLEGETQLANYISQGNARDPQQEAWRTGAGVRVVAPMLPMVYPPPQLVVPTPRGGVVIRTAWCMPGLLAYAVQLVPVPQRQRVEVEERERQRVRHERDLRARNVLVPVAVGVGTVAAAIAGRALWRHFWRAVAVRFAVRGAIAAGLALADGPLPVGDLVAVGLSIVTIVQIGAEWNSLWRQADEIAAAEGT